MTGESHPSTWVVIPTFWGPRQGSLFDHPTPLDGESTLPRLLSSLTRQLEAPPFSVLVVAASVDRASADEVSRRLRELVDPFRDALQLSIADQHSLDVIARTLNGKGLDHSGIDLASYAGVRNLQLLAPAALGAELIVAVDDDEVVSPMHLARALHAAEILGQRGASFGIAGPYLDAHGSPFLPQPSGATHLFDQKSALMNQTLRGLIGDSDPFPVTPMALGGNMVFPRRLFTQIGFDPGITRGEDIDYLINARMAGAYFYFDKLLAIEHLPPRHYEATAYSKLRHDIFRFVYEREKLRLAGIAPEAFDPYPGGLLREGLLDSALDALASEYDESAPEIWGNPDSILAGAQAHASSQAPEYFEFARRWPAIVRSLASSDASGAILGSLAH